ncbi:MAG: hypothetical protein GKR94_21380 [Gammaproteobacteria bacterium]|nr:hypothetical protein [Gammaproteobacteria bacterium]
MGPELTVLAPGLLGPWPAAQCRFVCEGLQLPSFSLLFARGSVAGAGGGDDSLSGALCEAFGLRAGASGWPVAALTRLVDGAHEAGGRAFLRADPVHLEAQPHGAQVVYGEALRLSREEAVALAGELAELPAPGPPQALAAYRWYVPMDDSGGRGCGEVGAVTTHPLDVAVTRVRGSLLPGGDGGGPWRAWLTQAQMILHRAPLNERRVSDGLPAVNSLWLWGGGALPPRRQASYARALGADPLLIGLCRHHGLAHECWDGGWPAAADALARGGNTLLLWTGACSLARRGDVESWREALQRFEVQLARPVVGALRDAKLRAMRLLMPPAPALRVTRGQLWRWWRRKHWLHYTGLEAWGERALSARVS